MYCYKCGNKMSDGDNFCVKCGTKAVEAEHDKNAEISAAESENKINDVNLDTSAKPVKYVYYDPKTGKSSERPTMKAKSKTESVVQGLTVAFVSLALIIMMIVGTMFISGQRSKNVFYSNAEQNVSLSDISSKGTTALAQSSDKTKSKTTATTANGLTATEINRKIKGRWSTSLPYGSMNIPAELTFNGNGVCSCTVNALFISKTFNGKYTVKDGGFCTVTLNGLEEYTGQQNSLSGNIEFVTDDKVKITFKDGVVWYMTRV